MALPNDVNTLPLKQPAPRPLRLVATIDRTAGASRNYTAGRASARTLTYPSLWAFTWWSPARTMRNRGHRRYIGGRGVEDIGEREL